MMCLSGMPQHVVFKYIRAITIVALSIDAAVNTAWLQAAYSCSYVSSDDFDALVASDHPCCAE
jgi:hypothetical protein